MKYQVQDHTGHSTIQFVPEGDVIPADEANTKFKSMADAETEFNRLKSEGKWCWEPGKNGEPGKLVRKFKDVSETAIWTNQLAGG